MTDISEYEARIQAALDRVEYGLGQISQPASQNEGGESDELRALLQEEREKYSSLEKRIGVLSEKQEEQLVTVRDRNEKLIAARERNQKLKAQVEDLQKALRDLQAERAQDALDLSTVLAEMELAVGGDA
ncbi:MAG: hypothetical protein ABJO67_14535 [Pseudoruegeria sp.]